MLGLISFAWATTFTDVTAGSGAEGDGTEGRGIGVADLNGDDRLDLVVLGREYGSGGRLLLQGSTPLTFSDATATLAPGFANRQFGRQVLLADLNSDGRLDATLSSSEFLSVFLQNSNGTFGHTNPMFAGADWEVMQEDHAAIWEPSHPNQISGLNLEGVVAFDPNGDGFLDLQSGWRMTQFTDPGVPADAAWMLGADGLDAGYQIDDYPVMDDFDGDGFLDLIVARGSVTVPDVFWGSASGWVESSTPNFLGAGVKGGFAVCDFDGDGDLDLFRTHVGDPNLPPAPNSANRIWHYDSGLAGFTQGVNPGVDTTRGTFATACGDIDNDMDADLVVAYADGGVAIYRNLGGGASWATDNGGVTAGLTMGIALVDLDGDGDLDLYLNQAGPNALWRNNLNDERYLKIEILANVGTCENPILRDDLHARFRIKDWSTLFETPVRSIQEASGTGTSTPGPTHVGLGAMDPLSYYRVDVWPYAVQPDGSPPWMGWESVSIPDVGPGHIMTIRSDDLDADGVQNTLEGMGDTDGDGVPNYIDWDSDGDQLWDGNEVGPFPCTPRNTDGDAWPDFLDPDSDNDGVEDDVDCNPLDATVSTSALWYSDDDGDGFGDVLVATDCVGPAGSVLQSGDCDDTNPAIHPDADERCDSVDRNCDGSDTLGAVDPQTGWLDADSDGFGEGAPITQCVLPGAYVGMGGDCDDQQPAAYPGAEEVCDGIDNSCDGTVDGPGATGASDFFPDLDNDGFGAGSPVAACTAPPGHRVDGTDCDDGNGNIFPNANEQCNDEDDDCDGLVDNGVTESPWFEDLDGDNHGAGVPVLACSPPPDHVQLNGDCDDTDPSVFPLATETCDGVDTNCANGENDAVDTQVWFTDDDGDGWGVANTGVSLCEAPVNGASQAGDCDDTDPSISPDQVEVCDGVDNDCNLVADDQAIDLILAYPDSDGDGFGAEEAGLAVCVLPNGWADNTLDCDDSEPLAWTGNPETCDGADNDCDGLTDGADPDLPPDSVASWYLDADGDGFGAGTPLVVCSPPPQHVQLGGDCDDANADAFPEAAEIPDNGVDEDCDGEDVESSPDRDGDGLPDSQEPPGDFDGDGLDNIEDPDSDNDGVVDGAEVDLDAVTSSGAVEPSSPPEPQYGCQNGVSSLGWAERLVLVFTRR